MITNTREKILAYIREKHQVRIHDLVGVLKLSHVAIHKQVKTLTESGVLQKSGKPPLVFYMLTVSGRNRKNDEGLLLEQDLNRIIAENYLAITPDGKLLYGHEGFVYWAKIYKPTENIRILAQQYKELIAMKKSMAPEGWIDASQKMQSTFSESYVSQLLFADTYSDPVFGRTKLAKLVMYAKQSGNKALTAVIAAAVKPVIQKIIDVFAVDAVGFIPPTVPRPVQFMDEFAKMLAISLPRIDLVKVIPGEVAVAQKSLVKLEERVLNARSSIYMRHIAEPSLANVLLIDDVAGSGASFQETATKLKAGKTGHQNIIAFAVIGNIRGYEIVRQM
jgi:hypothetical protein